MLSEALALMLTLSVFEPAGRTRLIGEELAMIVNGECV